MPQTSKRKRKERRAKFSSEGTVGFNMTSMIDIVFLLITFFMLTLSFAKNLREEELDLPYASEAADIPTGDFQYIVINVARTTGGHNIIVNRRPMLLGDLATELQAYAKEQRDAGRDVARTPVVLRADRNTPMDVVSKIYQLSQAAGLQTFNFQTSGSPEDEVTSPSS